MKVRVATKTVSAAKCGPTGREATLKDYDQIASLERRYGLTSKSYEEWAHLHCNNPLRYQVEPEAPAGWVIENEDGRIVGSVGNILLPYEFEGKSILSATGRGWVVEPAYRSLSLLLLDRLIHQPGVELFLTNALTPASAASFSALGCAKVPAGIWDRSAFWITHYQGFLESYLSKRHTVLARPGSYPLAAAMSLKDRLTTKALPTNGAEVLCFPCFDERFDDFWGELRTRNPQRLLAVRSREALEWHFRYALLKRTVWIAVMADGSRIAAYAIFDRRDNADFGLKRVRLVDYQSRDGTTHLLPPLLSWALKRCRDEGIHMLENVGAWLGKEEVIAKFAPHQRQLSTWTYVYSVKNSSLAQHLQDASVWAPTLFDASANL